MTRSPDHLCKLFTSYLIVQEAFMVMLVNQTGVVEVLKDRHGDHADVDLNEGIRRLEALKADFARWTRPERVYQTPTFTKYACSQEAKVILLVDWSGKVHALSDMGIPSVVTLDAMIAHLRELQDEL